VRHDDSSIEYLSALMTGPADTPYAGCEFFCDVYLPPSYPQVNPSVIFLTTGGGSARFNPNLYNDGKVCLSLLGTWAGPGWAKGVSTLSQVLLSIQAQILVEKPYANEPSFESKLASRAGRRVAFMGDNCGSDDTRIRVFINKRCRGVYAMRLTRSEQIKSLYKICLSLAVSADKNRDPGSQRHVNLAVVAIIPKV
jgi:ubiquitin-protein ligase